MDDLLKEPEQKIKPVLESLKQEFMGFRTNRPTPQLVEGIQVDYNGQMLKVKQLGSISIQPPRDINISVWDKSAAPLISKAIENSKLKLNATVDGNTVRIILPELTEERRVELVKLVKKTAEDSRIRIRNLREELNKEINRAFEAKLINEDQKFKSKEKVQEKIDKANKDIEEMLRLKIKEIDE